MNSSFECTPLVIGNRMYVTSPDDTVSALDATTGEIQWIYTPKLLFPANFQQFCCGRVNRSVRILFNIVLRRSKPIATAGRRTDAINNSGKALGR